MSSLLELLDERDERYELVDGHVVVSPPARFAHERTINAIRTALTVAAPPGVEVLGDAFAVQLPGGGWLLPDALVARTEHCEELGTSTPLLVVEVLSPSTRRRDRGEKRERYAELGVPHYCSSTPTSRCSRSWSCVPAPTPRSPAASWSTCSTRSRSASTCRPERNRLNSAIVVRSDRRRHPWTPTV